MVGFDHNSILFLPTVVYCTGRILLMKYYNFLWQSFPQDHMITLERLNKIITLKDDIIDTVVSSTNSEKGNKMILNISLHVLDADEDLRQFYLLVERIISNPKLSKIISVFKNGR